MDNKKDFTIITYNNERVLTTSQAADRFNVTEKNITDNYNNNKSKFVIGKHFHNIEGEELRNLKMDTDYIGVVPKTASHLRLWTKRGIARHAKILTTDEAWAIYEELEEKYFNPMQIISMTLTEITAHNANQLVLLEKQQLQLEREIQEVKQEVKQTTEVIEKRTAIAVSKAETVNRRMDKFEDCFKERQPGEYTSGEIAEKLMVYSSNKNPHSQFISKVAKKLFQDKYSRSGSVDIGEGFKKITYHQERIIPYIMEFIETSTNYVTTTDKKGNCLRVYRLFNKNFTVIIYKAA